MKELKDRLDQVSPTFCLAKWLHSTVRLDSGTTASCCKSDRHPIPLEEIRKNPSAIHNTKSKLEEKKALREGERHDSCRYCWEIEANDKDAISDRVLRSRNSDGFAYLDEIVQKSWNHEFTPIVLEVGFGNACNFKCAYCDPSRSSRWHDEISRFGPYPTSSRFNNLEDLHSLGLMPVSIQDQEEYTQAFWKWWPELSKKLKSLRITGGEPLLSESTFQFLNLLEKQPNPMLTLAINSNLCVPEKRIESLIEKSTLLLRSNKIKELIVSASIDAYGERAEYIRDGMNHETFFNNIEKLITRIPEIKLYFAVAFNVLSATSFKDFLKAIQDIKNKYSDHLLFQPQVSTNHVTYPDHLSVQILPELMKEKIRECAEFMEENSIERGNKNGFTPVEIDRVYRTYRYSLIKLEENELRRRRNDFYLFFSEHDKRRNKKILQTFPELESFWKTCQLSAIH